jgi:hypothetical protein
MPFDAHLTSNVGQSLKNAGFDAKKILNMDQVPLVNFVDID